MSTVVLGGETFTITENKANPPWGSEQHDLLVAITDAINSPTTTDTSSGSITIAVGDTLWHPYLTIRTADTFTVNGRLASLGTMTVNGTLVVGANGTVVVVVD